MKQDIEFEIIIDKLLKAIDESRACTKIMFEMNNNVLNVQHSEFSQELNDLYEYLYEKELMDLNYNENSKKLKNKPINEMTFNEIMTILTSANRSERFCDGYMFDFVQSGKMMECLNRLKMILKNIL